MAAMMSTERTVFSPGGPVPAGDGEDVPDVPAGVVDPQAHDQQVQADQAEEGGRAGQRGPVLAPGDPG